MWGDYFGDAVGGRHRKGQQPWSNSQPNTINHQRFCFCSSASSWTLSWSYSSNGRKRSWTANWSKPCWRYPCGKEALWMPQGLRAWCWKDPRRWYLVIALVYFKSRQCQGCECQVLWFHIWDAECVSTWWCLEVFDTTTGFTWNVQQPVQGSVWWGSKSEGDGIGRPHCRVEAWCEAKITPEEEEEETITKEQSRSQPEGQEGGQEYPGKWKRTSYGIICSFGFSLSLLERERHMTEVHLASHGFWMFLTIGVKWQMGSPLVETDGIYCIFNDSINSGQHASSWELAEKKRFSCAACRNIETNQFYHWNYVG